LADWGTSCMDLGTSCVGPTLDDVASETSSFSAGGGGDLGDWGTSCVDFGDLGTSCVDLGDLGTSCVGPTLDDVASETSSFSAGGLDIALEIQRVKMLGSE
jgi:cytochrome c551/c552